MGPGGVLPACPEQQCKITDAPKMTRIAQMGTGAAGYCTASVERPLPPRACNGWRLRDASGNGAGGDNLPTRTLGPGQLCASYAFRKIVEPDTRCGGALAMYPPWPRPPAHSRCSVESLGEIRRGWPRAKKPIVPCTTPHTHATNRWHAAAQLVVDCPPPVQIFRKNSHGCMRNRKGRLRRRSAKAEGVLQLSAWSVSGRLQTLPLTLTLTLTLTRNPRRAACQQFPRRPCQQAHRHSQPGAPQM